MARPLPRYIVAQMGARRGYAVPKILAQAGMLERFYTDVCGNQGWGRWLALGARLPLLGPTLRKLANRKVPETVLPFTTTFAAPNLRWHFHRLLHRNESADAQFRTSITLGMELGEAACANDQGDATHLFVMLTEFSPLMREAKRRGVKVVSEIYILLSSVRIENEERAAFPDWEPIPMDVLKVMPEFGMDTLVPNSVDHFICPSPAVAADLVTQWGVRQEAVSIVPYGMNPAWLTLEPKTKHGRVLFVGSAILRKGIHYLGMAAEELQKRGRNYEFRIAGDVTDCVRSKSTCRHLHFLGRVPRDRIHEEFQKADVFTLPSLAEGSAEVTYEALAAGLPLVTTEASGSVIRDGVEGRLIPERDPVALADAIESIIEDRAMRDRMASAARFRAADYTWEKYGDRLISVLSTI
jgi:glycosyltransferase involved in cell wall biosynthesis